MGALQWFGLLVFLASCADDYTKCQSAQCCNTGCLAGSCNSIMHGRGWESINFKEVSKSYCTWKLVYNKHCCRDVKPHDFNGYRFDFYHETGVCSWKHWLAPPTRTGSETACATRCSQTKGCQFYSYCPTRAPFFNGGGNFCKDPGYKGQCQIFGPSCGKFSSAGEYNNFYTYKLSFRRNDAPAAPSRPITSLMDWGKFMPLMKAGGICSSGYIRGDKLNSPASVDKCRLHCLNHPPCRYAAYCPASAGCGGSSANRCSLYTTCNSIISAGVNYGTKYSVYKMNPSCTSDRTNCYKRTDEELIARVDWKRAMTLQGTGICSGGYISAPSGQLARDSVNECKMRCLKNYNQGCRYMSFCSASNGCSGSRANRCALYTSACGAPQTAGFRAKYSLYKVADAACGQNPAACYNVVNAQASIAQNSLADDDLLDIDDLFAN